MDIANKLSHCTGIGRITNIKQEYYTKIVCSLKNFEDMDPIHVPQKLSIPKFGTATCNFPLRKHTETSVASLANNGARRHTEPRTLSYSAHFTSEGMKDDVEHVLKN